MTSLAMVWNGFGLIRMPAPTASRSGPSSLARKIEVAMMSCPFAGMTRIRFKGSPRLSRRLGSQCEIGGLSAPSGAPLGTPVIYAERVGCQRGGNFPFPREQLRVVERGNHSIALQQPLDVIELFLRAGEVAEALAQFLDDAPRPLHVDLARHFHGGIVAIFAPAQR